jgi:hypothetical protein
MIQVTNKFDDERLSRSTKALMIESLRVRKVGLPLLFDVLSEK